MPGKNANHYCMAIAPPELSDEAKQALDISNRRAALLNDFRWQPGNTLTIRFMEGDPGLQQRVRQAAEGWLTDAATGQRLANLQFSFVPAGFAHVRIAFQQGAGSWSQIGTACNQVPQAQSTMNFGWLTPNSSDEEIRSVVLHEFGHALGLIHEHQNPVGGIQWNEAAVFADLSRPPNNWDEATIRFNVLDRFDPSKVTATEVDDQSIMMYPIPASWTNGTFEAGFNGDLSPTDKQFIHGQYP